MWCARILLLKKPVVSIEVVSIRSQSVKLHTKKFDHFKLSLAFNKKNIWLECSLFFRQVFETIHTWTEQTFIETIGNRL